MKKQFTYSLLALALLLGFYACKKDESKGLEPNAATIQKDSGTYNANSYFPLIWGAEWTYQHSNGEVETITCGYQELDSVTEVHYPGVFKTYSYHWLYSNLRAPINRSELCVGHYGEYYIWGEYISCNRRFPSPIGFMIPILNKNDILPVAYCPPYGPTDETRAIGCLADNIAYAGFNDVKVFLNAKWGVLKNSSSLLDFEEPRLTAPIVISDSADFTVSWYAKGVGLIRRETYIQNKLSSSADLVSYSFPN